MHNSFAGTFCLIAFVASSAMTDSKPTNDKRFWRKSEFGAINCLILMSHLYGVETNFIDAEIKDGLPQSGRELIELSQRIGLALETRAVSPEELNKMALPVIFHVDGDSPEKGAFHVLIGRNSQRVSYFNGPAAVIMSEDREIFQRNWSGIVFYPKRRFWEANQFALISLTITFVLSVIWGIFKKGDVK